MTRTFIFWGALFAGLAVAAGAFGAHALKALLAVEMLAVFETAARYQMYHALALLFIGLADVRGTSRSLRAAGWMFVLGIGLFSGSLYAMALSGVRWLGAVTPLGGAAFIVGWVLVIAGCCRHRAEM